MAFDIFDIKTYVSKSFRNLLTVDLFNSLSIVLEDIRKDVRALNKNIIPLVQENEQSIIDWEKWIELIPQAHWTLEDRQARIIYTVRNKDIFNHEFIHEGARLFSNAEVEITEFPSEFKFHLLFVSQIGKVPNFEPFIDFIETNKPAHLIFEYTVRGRTHDELGVFKHDHLANYTHQELTYKENL